MLGQVTGWGFAVFLVGSMAWVVVAVSTDQQNLLWTNGFLTLVNAIGIWRWLGRQAKYEDGSKAAEAKSAARRVQHSFRPPPSEDANFSVQRANRWAPSWTA